MTDMIHLILKYKWFDLIEKGEKRIEYRDATEFYRKRLQGKDKVCFHRGYTNKTMTFTIDRVKETLGLFRIYLGQRLPIQENFTQKTLLKEAR